MDSQSSIPWGRVGGGSWGRAGISADLFQALLVGWSSYPYISLPCVRVDFGPGMDRLRALPDAEKGKLPELSSLETSWKEMSYPS